MRFERLEQRRLLAADLAAIAGVAFNDLDADGLYEPAAGETGLSGIEVSLQGTDDMGPVSRTLISGANGEYRFDGLRAGSYTLQQLPPAPAGILPSSASREVTITVTPDQANGAFATTIDSFSGGDQELIAIAPGAGNPDSGSAIAPGALGGTRDLYAEVTSPTGITTASANSPFLPGVLDVNPGSSASARYLVTWDGDTDPLALSASGLRGTGLDLTSGGDMHGLLLRMGVDKTGQEMTLRVYSDAANYSEVTVELPNTGGMATEDVYVPWSEFTTAQGTGGDLTDVGAIQLEINATVSAMDGQIDLIATRGPAVIAAHLANIPVSAGIDIEKSTNGFDADSGSGPLVAQGGPVTFEYVVRNTGNSVLGNVQVMDDNGTVGLDGDDFAPIRISGDVDADGLLDLNEVWIYRASGVADLGQYVNIGNVTANPVGQDGIDIVGVSDVSDADPSRHFAVAASVAIEKSTNGEDADTGSGPIVATGDQVRFEYVVRNTGNVALADVQLTDDNGTSQLTDDFAPTLLGGDVNANGRLDVTETWTYEAFITAGAGVYENLGSVTANPVDESGADILVLSDVSDADPSRHFALAAAVDIEKHTNGEDADTPEGPYAKVGSTVEFTYLVTNTGNVALGDVDVTDTEMGGLTFVGGDDDGDGLLDVTETWTYTASAEAAAGQHVCSGLVTANPVFDDGADVPTVANVTDTDPSHYFGVISVIHLEKTTNGEDADTGPGPTVVAGEEVVFQYTVTNPGNRALRNVSVWDDAGTPTDTSDDVQPALVSGDTDSDGLLDPGEAWMYEWLSSAIVGPYQNRAVVAADDFFGESVEDEDYSAYLGLEPLIPQSIPPNVPNKRRFLSSTW